MRNSAIKSLIISLYLLLLIGACSKRETFYMKPEPRSLEQILIIQPNCDNPVSMDLVAGRNFVIGTVTAIREGNSVTVAYKIDDPLWSISEIHLAIGEIPVTRKNNPKVGQFGIHEVYDNPIKSKTFTVDLHWNDFTLPVAAHAVVQKNLATIVVYSDPIPIPGCRHIGI